MIEGSGESVTDHQQHRPPVCQQLGQRQSFLGGAIGTGGELLNVVDVILPTDHGSIQGNHDGGLAAQNVTGNAARN